MLTAASKHNAILYTDYFLSNGIDFLKQYDGQYETAMLYVSDHGESLGEHFDCKIDQLKPYRDYPLSHDDLFCMLLIGYEIDSKICEGRRNVLLENIDIKSGKAN